MTTKEVKAWLSRLYLLKEYRKDLERARREAYDRLTSITAAAGGSVVSGTKDPHKYDELVALNHELDEQINVIGRMELDIVRAIDSVEDLDCRKVLFLRYYENRRWDDIAMRMSYHERTVFRIHGRALKAIEPFIQKIVSKCQ